MSVDRLPPATPEGTPPAALARLAVVGMSFRSATLAEREGVAVAPAEMPDALARLVAIPGVSGAAIVSTCNRMEAWLEADPGSLDAVAAAACPRGGAGVYRHQGVDAARHAFRVAAGLDAMALGDAQVLGQFKAAFRDAEAAGTLSPALARLRDRAIRAAREARTHTGVGRHAVSISHVAVELVRKVFADLAGRRVLILGSGKMCAHAGRRLVEAGARTTVVAGRQFENAARLAAALGGVAVPKEALAEELPRHDVVVTGTACPQTLIDRGLAEASMRERRGRPQLIVDIALPRDVDPAVRSVAGVFLYDLDDLRSVAEANARERRREAGAAEQVVAEAAAAFAAEHHDAAPLVVRLRRRAEEIRVEELRRAKAGLGPLTAEQEAAVDAATRAIVNKLLHAPTTHLRVLGQAGNEAALRLAGSLLGVG
jgi:glutamyl-tRNA reductase